MGVDGDPDVDYVLTRRTGQMIKSAGIHVRQFATESFDMPFGFYTGAGVIFGNSAA